MNKQQLFMAGSVLLATTSLAGVAQAGIVTTVAATAANAALSGATTFSGAKIANTIFSTTASTANAVQVGPTSISIKFSNVFTPTTKFSVEIDPINASFVTSGMAANLLLGSGGSFGVSISASAVGCTSVTPLTTKIILDSCGNTGGTNGNGADVSASYVGITLTGVTFNNASGLAAVGGTVGVSGFVYNPTNAASVYENITAGNVVTAVSPIVTTVISGPTTTVLTTSTPVAFAYFDSATDYRTAVLASVNMTGVGALDKDLTSVVSGRSTLAATGQVSAVSSINVTVTSSALSQAAATSVSVAGVSVAIFNGSVSNFSAGVATFSINLAGGYDSFSIQVSFSGTAAISAASAGTVTVVHGSGQGNLVQAVPAVTGKTGTISLGGFSAELNTFLSSTNAAFSSFARIHNNGAVAAAVTVTVKNDATGATMGTYTTSSIATGQTLQISAKDIETGAGITAALGVNYTLNLQGAFSGYAQHIIFNPATGQLADLSAFRNKGAAGSTSP